MLFSFLGLSQSLPVTSYVKMIDIWMLFTMTVPFLEVVMHTTNEAFKQPRLGHFSSKRQVNVVTVKAAKEADEEEKVLSTSVRLAGLVLPASSLIFTLVFWILGLIQSYSSIAIQDPNMTDCLKIDHD